MPRTALTLGVVALLLLSASARADDPLGTVTGIVVLEGDPPAPSIVELKPDMQKLTGKKTLNIQPWIAGKNYGLANCVLTLRGKDPTNRSPVKPLERAVLEKDGPSFVPRVLVITTGTKLNYRNKNSPCKCFVVQGSRHEADRLVSAGSQHEMQFDKPDTCRVTSNLRPYMLGWIHVVDTPFYAISDAEGHFKITSIPPGEYRVRVWHEGVGWVRKPGGPSEITIKSGATEKLEFKVVSSNTKRK